MSKKTITVTELKRRANNTFCPGCYEPVTGNYDLLRDSTTSEKVHKCCTDDAVDEHGGEIIEL